MTLVDADEALTVAAIIERVNASHQLDADRARDSYTNHTATALRRRVLAASNGHSMKGRA